MNEGGSLGEGGGWRRKTLYEGGSFSDGGSLGDGGWRRRKCGDSIAAFKNGDTARLLMKPYLARYGLTMSRARGGRGEVSFCYEV